VAATVCRDVGTLPTVLAVRRAAAEDLSVWASNSAELPVAGRVRTSLK
jgi:hypothetical protein